jgi:hypothetical protein
MGVQFSKNHPALHLGCWLCTSLANLLPVGSFSWAHLPPGQPPAQYAGLHNLRREVCSLDCVCTASLQVVKSAKIYKELTATLHNPWVERLQPHLFCLAEAAVSWPLMSISLSFMTSS